MKFKNMGRTPIKKQKEKKFTNSPKLWLLMMRWVSKAYRIFI
jgi:hypothetical protein